MAATIKIKRGTGYPTGLVAGELAYSTDLARLYVGGATDATQVAGGNSWVDPIVNATTTTPPGSPADGDRYIVGTGATGAWATHDGKIAEYSGAAWIFTTPVEGLATYNKATDQITVYSGAAWVGVDSTVTLQDAYNTGATGAITLSGPNGPIALTMSAGSVDGVLQATGAVTSNWNSLPYQFQITGAGAMSSARPMAKFTKASTTTSVQSVAKFENTAGVTSNAVVEVANNSGNDVPALSIVQDGAAAHIRMDAATPTSAASGDVWYDASNNLRFNDGTGSRTVATLEENQTVSGNLTLSGSNTLSGSIATSGAGAKLNVVTTGYITIADAPTNDTDAANKAYVDSVAAGLDPKASVRVATTANITLSGAQTIDGVSAIAGNRVLVKDQTTTTQNGIYVVAAGAWSRSTDMDGTPANEVSGGNFTFVEEGSTNQDTGWVLTGNGILTLGTDAIVWVQFSSAGITTASNGITKVVNDFQLDLTSLTATTAVTADSVVFIDASDSNNEKKTTLTNFFADLDVVTTAGITNGLLTKTADDTYVGRTVTGTASRLSVSNGNGVSGNPTLDIDAAYVGQTSITTLGTITTGTWNGTTIAIANGGTGQTTATAAFDALAPTTTAGDIIYRNGSNNVRLAAGTATQVLHGGTTPSWSAVSLTADVSGTLPVTNGGTGLSSATQGSILWASAANVFTALDGSTAADNSSTVTALLGYASGTDTVVWTTAIDGGTFA